MKLHSFETITETVSVYACFNVYKFRIYQTGYGVSNCSSPVFLLHSSSRPDVLNKLKNPQTLWWHRSLYNEFMLTQNTLLLLVGFYRKLRTSLWRLKCLLEKETQQTPSVHLTHRLYLAWMGKNAFPALTILST